MKKLTSIAVLLCASVLASCGKEAFPDITGPMAESRIKFFNFGVGTPGVYFYANNNKAAGISGVSIVINTKTGVVTSATESVAGTTYPKSATADDGVTAGGYYSAIAPGSYDLSAKLADTTQRATVVSKITTTLAAGKAYSFYISGAYDTGTKTADSFVLEDNFPQTKDWSQAYVRFVNASPTSAPMTLYGTNTTTSTPEAAIGAITAYKAGSAFVAVPNGVYTIVAKDAGGVSKVTRTSVSFSSGRVYTIALRGTTALALNNNTNQ
ncbi:MAG: DUF4397 domain-containing protein [Gemmatimonadetes bacterium]|nr:DUF4397 domain-containing protein [Gemmatimonadota bacterium]